MNPFWYLTSLWLTTACWTRLTVKWMLSIPGCTWRDREDLPHQPPFLQKWGGVEWLPLLLHHQELLQRHSPIQCTLLNRWAPLGRSGQLVGKSTGLVIERLPGRIPAGAAGEFSSPELTLCIDSYSVSVPPPCYRRLHVKGPGHSAKSAGGRFHLNTHTLLTQRSQSGLTMPMSRHSVGTYPETSSHATCQGTFSHSHLNPRSCCGLIQA